MKRKAEILLDIKDLRADIKELMDANKDVPVELVNQLNSLMTDYENIKDEKINVKSEVKVMDIKKIVNLAMHESFTKNAISDEAKENGIKMAVGTPGQVEAVDTRGGVLIPIQMLPFKELRAKYTDLSKYFGHQPVVTKTGWMPIDKYQGSAVIDGAGTVTYKPAQELVNFDELSEIDKKHLAFDKVEFSAKDYGCIIPLSLQVLRDAEADLLGLVGKSFVRRDVMLDNAKILAALGNATQTKAVDLTASNAKSIEVIDAVKTAYNKTLTWEYGQKAIIIVNQTMYDVLDKIKDDNGNYIMQPVAGDPTRKQIGGHEVVVVDNFIMADTKASGTITSNIFVVSAEDFLTIFDRQELEIAYSYESGFRTYSVDTRAVVRKDHVVVDELAAVKITVKMAE